MIGGVLAQRQASLDPKILRGRSSASCSLGTGRAGSQASPAHGMSQALAVLERRKKGEQGQGINGFVLYDRILWKQSRNDVLRECFDAELITRSIYDASTSGNAPSTLLSPR